MVGAWPRPKPNLRRAIDMIIEEDLVIANDGRYAWEIDGRAVFTGDEPAVMEASVQDDE